MTGLWFADHGPDPWGEGATPGVLVVHGSMDRCTTFAPLLPHLADVTVRRYDRRGYGRSLDAGVTDLAGHVEDVFAMLEGAPAVLVGHSIGGVMALAAAARGSDLVRAVVAYEAPMQWLPWWPADSAGGDAIAAGEDGGAPAVAERFFRRMVGDARWEALPDTTKAARRAEGAALVAELQSVRAAVPYDPAALRMPVVAGSGTESKPYHQRAARELAEAVPDGALVMIDGATHGAHQSHPEAFAGLVRRALTRVS